MSLAKIDLFQNIPFAEGLAYVKFQNNNYCNKKWCWGGRKEGERICHTKKFSTFAISLSHCSGWHTHPRFPYKVVTIFSRKEE